METESGIEVLIHNRIVDANVKLSLTSLRVFVLGVTRLLPRDDNRTASFPVADYTALIGASSHSVHDDLRAAAQELLQAEVEIPADDYRQKPRDKRSWETVRLITDARLEPHTGEFKLTFTDAIIRYITNQRRNSCRFDLRQAMALTSRHAFRCFTLVKSWRGKKDAKGVYQPFFVGLEELRTRLGIAKDEYKKYSHFRARVLDDSVAQLQTHTDLCFSYRPRKKSRKIVQFAITLKSNAPSLTTAGMEALDCLVQPNAVPTAPATIVDTASEFRKLKERVDGSASTAHKQMRSVAQGWSQANKTKSIKNKMEDVDHHRHMLQLARDFVPLNPQVVTEREKYLANAEAALAALVR